MNLDRLIVYLSCIGLAVMAGCAGIEYTTQEMESDSRHYTAPLKVETGRAIVNVLWVPLEQMPVYCGTGVKACAVPVGDEWFVYTEKPRSWNDSARLRRLGHEVLHSLNSRHE